MWLQRSSIVARDKGGSLIVARNKGGSLIVARDKGRSLIVARDKGLIPLKLNSIFERFIGLFILCFTQYVVSRNMLFHK